MPTVSIASTQALPRSHCFFTLSYGRTIRTVRIRTGVVRALAGLVALLSLWLVASSAYLATHDDLVASLMAREAASQYAYEDRIVALRGQVEHEASLKLVGQTRLDGRLKELAARANELEMRAGLLAAITTRLGAPDAQAGLATTRPHDAAAAASVAPGYGSPAVSVNDGTRKPRLEDQSEVTDPARSTPFADTGSSFNSRFATAEERLQRVDAAQSHSLTVLASATRRRAEALRAAFSETGLGLERLGRKPVEPGVGGPFVAIDPALMHSAFGQTVDSMTADMNTMGVMEQAVPHIPLGKPVAGTLEVSSPFGPRIDPFFGRAALHTGVDLRGDSGTTVRATAQGRVVSAGYAGGYGLMVEVDHGHGLTTRYAHLSSIGVSPGQSVDKGAILGEVGATGRATGPHLHYETRIDGEPVDPERFLQAGSRLAALDARL